MQSLSREKLELDVQMEQLKKLGELTGGKMLKIRELPELLAKLPDQSRVVVLPPQETELWNNWWILWLECWG